MVDKSKFKSEGYSLHVTGKSLQITPAMEAYVQEKLTKIERFTNNILDIAVTLEVQKLAHTASIVMNFMHYRIQVHATTTDLYAAIDGAFNKLYKLLRRYKGKLQNHKRNEDLATVDMHVHVLKEIDEVEDINDEIDNQTLKEELEKYEMPKIVSKDTMSIKMLTQDEAVMKMDLAGENFLIYKCEEDQKLKILYKRNDKELGIVEIQK
ncbi:MAG: ribosome-associated translation inhibitor RaiA [Parachlamydiales bacterium]|nr:ribosome-associated translation inhibitor RaiA [Parachlamydiales bacterium]